MFWKAQIDCRFSTFSFCVNNNNNYEDDDDDDVVDYCGKQQLFHTKYDGGIELQSTRSSMSSSQKHCRHHWIKVNSNNQNKTIDRIEHKQSIRYNERDFLLYFFFFFFFFLFSSKIFRARSSSAQKNLGHLSECAFPITKSFDVFWISMRTFYICAMDGHTYTKLEHQIENARCVNAHFLIYRIEWFQLDE